MGHEKEMPTGIVWLPIITLLYAPWRYVSGQKEVSSTICQRLRSSLNKEDGGSLFEYRRSCVRNDAVRCTTNEEDAESLVVVGYILQSYTLAIIRSGKTMREVQLTDMGDNALAKIIEFLAATGSVTNVLSVHRVWSVHIKTDPYGAVFLQAIVGSHYFDVSYDRFILRLPLMDEVTLGRPCDARFMDLKIIKFCHFVATVTVIRCTQVASVAERLFENFQGT